MLVPVSFQWTHRVKSNSHPCLLLCFALCRLWVWFFPYSVFFSTHSKKDFSGSALYLWVWLRRGWRCLPFVVEMPSLCSPLLPVNLWCWSVWKSPPFCFFYSIWRLSVHWRLIIKCWGVTVCTFNTLWPHVCCSLSFCYVFFFFSPSASSWDNPEQSHPPHGK